MKRIKSNKSRTGKLVSSKDCYTEETIKDKETDKRSDITDKNCFSP